jgi:pyruvate/2-oxoglutarate dehydrogenase complex dihydrolipoamide dehydrogenase (E3) component
MADKAEMQVDVYCCGLEHNDRAILEGDNVRFIKVVCKTGTDEIANNHVYKIESGGTSLFDPYP